MAKMDKEDLRNQVNKARRAGYTEDQIIQFLSGRDDRVVDALNQGYKPSDVLNFLAPQQTTGETAERMVGAAARGAGPAAIGATVGGALGGLPGMAVGSLAYPMTDLLVGGVNAMLPEGRQMTLPSEGMKQMLGRVGMGGTPPETRGERVAEAAGEAVMSAGGGVIPRAAGVRAGGPLSTMASEMGRAPLTQMITAPISAASSQVVGEETGNPLAAILAGAAPGAAAGFRPRMRGDADALEKISTARQSAYDQVSKSGVLIDDSAFRTSMFDVTKDLRKEGYTPTNPKFQGIRAAIDELQSNQQPKDIVELQAMRKLITEAADPRDPSQYRMMTVLRDRFDNYIDNIDSSSVLTGDEKGLQAWRVARDLFNKERKAEVFGDILANAPIAKGAFSQSGVENYLYNELKKLAKNKQKMRIFSQAEQESIRKAAEGSGLQNLAKVVGKFSPQGFFPLLATGALAAVDPGAAASMAATGFGARNLAEQMRTGDIQRIIDQIASGRAQPSPYAIMPTTLSRGLLSTQIDEER
jgi:hypothetical protein